MCGRVGCMCAYVRVCVCVCAYVCVWVCVCECMGAYLREAGVRGLRVQEQHSPVVVPVYATTRTGGPVVFAVFELSALLHPDFVAQVSVAKVMYMTTYMYVKLT